jgi:hypothetical protein
MVCNYGNLNIGKQAFHKAGLGLPSLHGMPSLNAEIPEQEHVESIKSQQMSVSREREKMIQEYKATRPGR